MIEVFPIKDLEGFIHLFVLFFFFVFPWDDLNECVARQQDRQMQNPDVLFRSPY